MSRKPGIYWHKGAGCYASNSGMSEAGKRKTLYFRGFPEGDKLGAKAALDDYLAAKDVGPGPGILQSGPGMVVAGETCKDVRATSNTDTDVGDFPTDKDVVRAFVADADLTKSPRTAESRREILGKFSEFRPHDLSDAYGTRPARDIRAVDLTRMRKAWEAEGYSPNYRARLIRTVKACWAWAAALDPDRNPERLIPENPLKDFKGVLVPQSPERYAERKELADFLRFTWRLSEGQTPVYRRFTRLLALAIRVLAHTGARPGEICEARWCDFDPKKGRISLPPDRHKTGGKTGKFRSIDLTDLMIRALLRERSNGQYRDHIFTHKRGKGGKARGATLEQGEPWNSRALSHAIRRIRNQAIDAGVKLADLGPNAFTAYRLRHTFATDAMEEGVPTAVVAAMMGTSERVLNSTYCHVRDVRVKEATKLMVRARRRRR